VTEQAAHTTLAQLDPLLSLQHRSDDCEGPKAERELALLGITQRDRLIQPLHHLARNLAGTPTALTFPQCVIAAMAVLRRPLEQCAKGHSENPRDSACRFTSGNRINSVFPLLIAQITFCDWFVRHARMIMRLARNMQLLLQQCFATRPPFVGGGVVSALTMQSHGIGPAIALHLHAWHAALDWPR
jgi:hypothetical protein